MTLSYFPNTIESILFFNDWLNLISNSNRIACLIMNWMFLQPMYLWCKWQNIHIIQIYVENEVDEPQCFSFFHNCHSKHIPGVTNQYVMGTIFWWQKLQNNSKFRQIPILEFLCLDGFKRKNLSKDSQHYYYYYYYYRLKSNLIRWGPCKKLVRNLLFLVTMIDEHYKVLTTRIILEIWEDQSCMWFCYHVNKINRRKLKDVMKIERIMNVTLCSQ